MIKYFIPDTRALISPYDLFFLIYGKAGKLSLPIDLQIISIYNLDSKISEQDNNDVN